MRKFITWNTLHTEHGSGSWAVIDDMLTVRTADGTKTAVVGGMAPSVLARILMRELSQDREDAVA